MSSEAPPDIRSITTTDYAVAEIQSNLMHAHLDLADVDGIEFGIQVYRDGPDIALSAGTTWTDNDDAPSISSYHALTVEQARDLSDALAGAADRAEELLEQPASAQEQGEKSLIGRLLK